MSLPCTNPRCEDPSRRCPATWTRNTGRQYGAITTRFNRLVDRAGVRRIRLHDVRHTYATMALDAGIDPKIVSDRIGHVNMAYKLAIYTHPSTGKDRNAAGKVAGMLGGHAPSAGPPTSAPTRKRALRAMLCGLVALSELLWGIINDEKR
ncbi:MAG TPA: tyrosine-type recombinase/integrase [Streptosporangiaceae bacterium]